MNNLINNQLKELCINQELGVKIRDINTRQIKELEVKHLMGPNLCLIGAKMGKNNQLNNNFIK